MQVVSCKTPQNTKIHRIKTPKIARGFWMRAPLERKAMVAVDNSGGGAANNAKGNKGKKRKFLPHGKPVRKGSYPLRPGVQGFFITCDGGRERQAAHEALNLLDTFFEELVCGKDCSTERRTMPNKPLNKIIKFEDSDFSGDEDDSAPHVEDPSVDKCAEESKEPLSKKQCVETNSSSHPEDSNVDKCSAEGKESPVENQQIEPDSSSYPEDSSVAKCAVESKESRIENQQIETASSHCDNVETEKAKNKSIDDLIEDELKELGDRNKRHFVSLDSGCNGVVFIQMHKRDGLPGPSSIVQKMMTSAASKRKHMSRFIFRVLPAEVTCYASEEEISRAIKPLIEHYFPTDASMPQKFAVLYEARANTGIERVSIINAVAKSVPQPHKVDLKNPDKSIIVQICKTICLVGIVEKYKELSKYNLRQLTSPQG